jgi:hypothetical protein
MGKAVLLLSFIGLTILFIFGITDPTSPVMWLASTSGNFAVLRIVMMTALAALLFSHPPRNVYLRALVGVLAFSLVGWCLNATYANEMKILDTMSILQFCISAGIVVLELEDEPQFRLPSLRNRQEATE